MKCFHHNDMDGYASAAIVAAETNDYNKEDYYEIDYVSEIPVEKVGDNEKVFFVDYSFTENNIRFLEKLIQKGCEIVWIDHHKSSIEMLKKHPEYGKIDGIIKVGESGALLTYKYFNPGMIPPMAIKLVSDYDCWIFRYGDDTTYFKLGVDAEDSSPLGEFWMNLIYKDQSSSLLDSVIKKGKLIKRYVDEQNKYYREHYGYESEILGMKCFVMSLKTNSWVFGEKYEEYPICVAWVFNGERYVYTVYSSRPDVDCDKIAKAFGGGGHAGAAGFSSKELVVKR